MKPRAAIHGEQSSLLLPKFSVQAGLLALVGFLFFANTLSNEYALDDDIVLCKNEHVRAGLAGVAKIFSTDAYDSYYRQMGSRGEELTGGRYRPLSIATFALEEELHGLREGQRVQWTNAHGEQEAGELLAIGMDDAMVRREGLPGAAEPVKVEVGELDRYKAGARARHAANVLLYVATAVLSLHLLRLAMPRAGPDLPFLASLFFLIHPVHTEVVANVKSRDELLSLLFLLLALVCALRSARGGGSRAILGGLLCYAAALLSKEYAITLPALLPAFFILFAGKTARQSVAASLPYLAVTIAYLALRWLVVGGGRAAEVTELLNDPYLLASPAEEAATKIFVLGKYLRLLLFPHPLSSDYSYRAIAYRDFSNALVWVSLAIHAAMIAATWILLRRRHPLGFALLFYLVHLLLVSNLVVDLGATMGERLIYHSSFGFALALAYVVARALQRLQPGGLRRSAAFAIVLAAIVPSAVATMRRNADWKNTDTLFLRDVQTVPESALANNNAGRAYVRLAEKANARSDGDLATRHLRSALRHLDKALAIHAKFPNALLNLGLAHFYFGDFDESERCWTSARELSPRHPTLSRLCDPLLAKAFAVQARDFESAGDPSHAAERWKKAVHYGPRDPEAWHRCGVALSALGQTAQAKAAWEQALRLDPSHEGARAALDELNRATQQR